MPHTLFIFLDNISPEPPFASLLLDDKGDVVSAYEKRGLTTLLELQKGNSVHVVLPSTLAKPHIVALPTLKKANLTVPNLLEDDLIQDVDELHFSLQTKNYVDNHYLVTVIDKRILTELIQKLESLGISVDVITNDFIFSPNKTLFLSSDYALLNQHEQAALFSPSLIQLYQPDEETSIIAFYDTHPDLVSSLENQTIVTKPVTYHEYVAKQMIGASTCNILQGAFQRKSRHFTRLPLLTYAIAGLAFLVFISAHLTQYTRLKHRLDDITQTNKTLYRVFFPNSQAMVSPRFRIEQRLKSQNKNTTNQTFFELINAVNKSVSAHHDVQIEDIVFQDNGLEIGLKTDNFHLLEAFRASLKSHPLSINQLSAKTQKKRVKAKWRVNL